MNIKFLIFVCLSPLFLFAQSNYQPAVIITNNGDSLTGKIDYRNWKYNPQNITFVNGANEKQIFDVYTIKEFYIPGANEIYASYTIDIDMLPGDQDHAINNTGIDSPILHKRVFLLQLVKHPALCLYQFTDKNKEHFYYVKGNGEPVELIHHYIYHETSKQVQESTIYKEQLKGLFTDCPAVTSNLSSIKFKRKHIHDHFTRYLQCKTPVSSVMDLKVEEPASVKLGIIAGLSSNRFRFEGSNDELADENYRRSQSPVFGISLDITSPRSRNKWHFVNELLYKSYQTGSSFSRPYNISYSRISDVELNFSYVQLNTIFRYVYQGNPSLKPYLNLGAGNAFMIAENKNILRRVYSFGKEENMKAFDSPNKYEFSLFGGIGMMVNHMEMEFRYGRSNKSFSPFHTLDVNPTSCQLLLTYQF